MLSIEGSKFTLRPVVGTDKVIFCMFLCVISSVVSRELSVKYCQAFLNKSAVGL